MTEVKTRLNSAQAQSQTQVSQARARTGASAHERQVIFVYGIMSINTYSSTALETVIRSRLASWRSCATCFRRTCTCEDMVHVIRRDVKLRQN